MKDQIEIPMEIPKSKNIPRPNWETLKDKYHQGIADYLIKEWCDIDQDRYELLEAVQKIFGSEYDLKKDAFELAKDFDNELYGVDAKLVDLLDNLPTNEIERSAIKEWVAATEMEPKLVLGQEVKMDVRHQKEGQHFVCKIDRDRRTYGAGLSPTATRYYLINWEKLEALNP